MISLKWLCWAAFAGVLAAYGVAHATIINVSDNGNNGNSPVYTGSGAAPNDPAGSGFGSWNNLKNINPGYTITPGSLVYSDGTSDAALAPVSVTAHQNGNSSGGFGDSLTNVLLGEGFYANGSTNLPTISIDHLNTTTPGQRYDLYIYGTNGGSVGGLFTLTQGTAAVNFASTTGVAAAADNTSGAHPGGFTANGLGGTIPSGSPDFGTVYTVISNILPDAGGTIAFSYQQTGTNGGIVNGFQLETVPEPASCGLLAVGAFGLLARKRRRPI